MITFLEISDYMTLKKLTSLEISSVLVELNMCDHSCSLVVKLT